MGEEIPDSGWQLVAQRDGAAALFATLVELDPGTEYTRSELAESADIPLKTLYLADTLEAFVDIGVLARADDGTDASEPCYAPSEDSPILAAAGQFEDAVSRELS